MTNIYDATSIRILTEVEIEERFDFVKMEKLADKYSVNLECIKRGFEASYRCNMNTEHFVERYLKGDKSIPINTYLMEAYKDLLSESRK